MALFNLENRDLLKQQLAEDSISRDTLSFYRYVHISDPTSLRDELYEKWEKWGVLGRIYLAKEGINAQLSVPADSKKMFLDDLWAYSAFKDIPLKEALEDDGKSFYKLKIKVREKLVADGLDDDAFDVTNVGKHLTAKEFNDALDQPSTIVVDMRNHYESEVGHFEGAICPDADTFRDELPLVLDELADKKDQKVLFYCTGGIRCEKASAFFKHHGFEDVNQLHGGIIDYAKQVQEQGLKSKFIGKNFVFDERLGERITEDVISKCHQCGKACDSHTNCANDECHLLFIQCKKCAEKYNACCTPECKDIAGLPIEEQRARRKANGKKEQKSVFKSRLRPNLREILNQEQHD